MTNIRPASKSPGRTPPFILVGLLVLLCILAYNYWTLSARNSDLTAKTEKLQTEARSISAAHESVQRSLEETQEKLRVTEGNLDQVRQFLKEKEGELDNVRNDMSRLQTEQSKCAEDLEKCDARLQSRENHDQSQQAEYCKPSKDFITPVKTVLTLCQRAIGPESLKMAFTAENIDYKQFMEVALNGDVDLEPPLQRMNDEHKKPLPEIKEIEMKPAAHLTENAEKEADLVVGKTEPSGITKAKDVSHLAAAITAEPLVFQPAEKKQMVEDGKENIHDSPVEVVKQNVNDDHNLKKEVGSTEATSTVDTKDSAKYADNPLDREDREK